MKQRSGGEVLVDGLIALGVERLYCVPGESYLAVLDALYDRAERLRVITCRQEGGAAYMAEADGKLCGRPGVVFVSRGPGAANAMVGVHTAYQDSTPMLLFIGQVARAVTGREAFQELDYRAVYSRVAKAVIRIERAERIAELLSRAWRAALSGRPGPVVVELPEDMLTEQVVVQDFVAAAIPAPAPGAAELARFRQLLVAAADPVLLVGGAGWTAAASRQLQHFSEKFQVPVATVFRRSDSFANTHPHYIGELGIGPNPALVEQVRAADLLIAVGPRLGDMTTGGYTTLVPPTRDGCNAEQKLVHVHISGDELGAVFAVDLGIVSTPENFLLAANALEPETGDWSREERLRAGHQCYLDWLERARNTDATVRMDRIMVYLRQKLTTDTVITVGAGNFSVWGQRNFQFDANRKLVGSTNGSMGYGVPSAIAAKLVYPDYTVVSFSGDGCFLMNGQELATAVRYGLAVVFIVVNNGRYGTIRSHQERRYPGRVSATGLTNPDFAALARAYGAYGATVTATDQFPYTFEQALAADGPALIELEVDY